MSTPQTPEDEDSEMEVKPRAKRKAPKRNVVKDSDEDSDPKDVESEVDSRPVTRAVTRTRQKVVKTYMSASIPTLDSDGKAGMHPDMAISIFSDSNHDDPPPFTTLLSQPSSGHPGEPKQQPPLSTMSRTENSRFYRVRRNPETNRNSGGNKGTY
jgi:hypothetical protein